MVRLPIQRLIHANVVVHDLGATARRYAQILGITRWDVRHWTPERLTESQAYGYQAAFGFSTATGSNSQGVTFRLVQPTHGFSTFTEFLITRGVGVHSLCVAELDAVALERVEGAVAQAATFPGGGRSLVLDVRALLGGFCIEVQTPAPLGEPDDRWDFTADAEQPAAVRWLAEIPRIGHFGIAVKNVMQRLPNYARLLGVERWSGLHFDTASGMLEHSTFFGRPVENAWLLAITEVADFGLELLQGIRGLTDYANEIAKHGEGIHHVLVRRGLSDDEWIVLRSWMESLQIGVVMSGRVRSGSAEFFYLDTRAALGFLLEVIVTRESPSTSPLPRFALDFSTPA